MLDSLLFSCPSLGLVGVFAAVFFWLPLFISLSEHLSLVRRLLLSPCLGVRLSIMCVGLSLFICFKLTLFFLYLSPNCPASRLSSSIDPFDAASVSFPPDVFSLVS